MLKSLSANNHKVTTGISIIDLDNNIEISKSLSTIVAMKTITNELLEKYIESGRGFDKAGAYSIQDTEYNFVETIHGCYLNVVGLPLCLLDELFVQLGYSLYLSNRDNTHELCNSSKYQRIGNI